MCVNRRAHTLMIFWRRSDNFEFILINASDTDAPSDLALPQFILINSSSEYFKQRVLCPDLRTFNSKSSSPLCGTACSVWMAAIA